MSRVLWKSDHPGTKWDVQENCSFLCFDGLIFVEIKPHDEKFLLQWTTFEKPLLYKALLFKFSVYYSFCLWCEFNDKKWDDAFSEYINCNNNILIWRFLLKFYTKQDYKTILNWMMNSYLCYRGYWRLDFSWCFCGVV